MVLVQAKPAHTTLPPDWTCTFLGSIPWGALHHCHYRCWLNKHNVNLVHMPGTHFATGWMVVHFCQCPNLGSNW